MNSLPNISAQLLTLEKKLKSHSSTEDIMLVVKYISLLKDDRYNKLLKSADTNEVNLLIGELKSYEKLLTTLSNNFKTHI